MPEPLLQPILIVDSDEQSVDNISSGLKANGYLVITAPEEGRVRQAKRMAEAALKLKAEGHYVIADFIAPTPEARNLFPADFIVWVDTIKKGRFEDTNQMFVNPKNFDFHVTTQDAKNWATKIIEEIKE